MIHCKLVKNQTCHWQIWFWSRPRVPVERWGNGWKSACSTMYHLEYQLINGNSRSTLQYTGLHCAVQVSYLISKD